MKRILGVLLAGMFISSCRGANSPTSPTPTPQPTQVNLTGHASSSTAVVAGGQTKTEICHRTGAAQFILISVAEPAVDAHIGHGDGRIGNPVPGQPGTKFSTNCTPVPVGPITITFASLVGNGSPFTSYSQAGFTVSPASGDWVALTTYGNPLPSIVFNRLATESTITAAVQITAEGSAFSFGAVDLYSSITPIPYVFAGHMNSVLTFSTAGEQGNTFGNFVTVTNPHATAAINTLLISLANPATPCCSNPVGLDNIVVTYQP
jgi:hypothetical protein